MHFSKNSWHLVNYITREVNEVDINTASESIIAGSTTLPSTACAHNIKTNLLPHFKEIGMAVCAS